MAIEVTSEKYGTVDHGFNSRDGATPETTIRLPPVGRVEGRLIADDPKLVRGVDIRMQTSGSGRGHVVSDNEGRFVVPAIAEGTLIMDVPIGKNLPFRAKLLEGLLTVRDADATRVEIPIVPAVRVEGVVRAEGTGQPIPGATLLLSYGKSSAWPLPMVREEVTSDGQGRFAAFVLPGDVKILAVRHPDGWRLPPAPPPDMGKSYSVPEGVKQFDLPPLELTRSAPASKRPGP
jgi:hypothetical protein